MNNLKDHIIVLESGSREKGGAVIDGIPSLGAEHLNDFGGFNLEPNKVKYVSENHFGKMKCGIIQKKDILIVKDGATTGKTSYVDEKFPFDEAAINEHVFLLRTKKDLHQKYLFYYLYSETGQHHILNDFRGATVGGISRNFIDMPIPLPPLETQQKIADVLDRAGALIEKRKAQIEKLDLLVKSQFIEMFGDPVTNPKGWKKILWPSLFHTTTGKLDSNAMVDDGEYPFFTCAKESFRIDKYAFDCEALILAGNNAAGIYDVKYYSGKFNAYQRTYVLTLKNADYQYSIFKIQLEQKLDQLRHNSKGTNTKYLTLEILNKLDFILPSPILQNQFADFVQQAEAQKSQLQQSLEKLELNYKSLMQKCFRGDLF